MLTRTISTLALALALTFVTTTAQAQTKPFKVSGGGTANHIPSFPGDTSTHWATGQGTELGEYYGDGIVRLDTPPDANLAADFSSAEPFVFIAANGDELAYTWSGEGELTFGE